MVIEDVFSSSIAICMVSVRALRLMRNIKVL